MEMETNMWRDYINYNYALYVYRLLMYPVF